jgi:hypothetical protein
MSYTGPSRAFPAPVAAPGMASDLMKLARITGGLAGHIEQADIPVNRKAEILAELASAGASLARAGRIAQHSAREKSAAERT